MEEQEPKEEVNTVELNYKDEYYHLLKQNAELKKEVNQHREALLRLCLRIL